MDFAIIINLVRGLSNSNCGLFLRTQTQLALLMTICFCYPFPSSANNISAGKKLARIISLAPSNTELIYSLHAENELLAVSDVCDFPPEAKTKERVGNLTSVKMEKIAILHPDLVLLVSGQETIANRLEKHGFKTLILDNSSISKIGSNLIEIGKACHKEREAQALSLAFNKALNELRVLTQRSVSKPRVFICVWPHPLMSAGKGSFINEGITICGGMNCTGDINQAYPRVNPERLLVLKPDMILIPREEGKEQFWKKAPWTSLNAVKSKHVYVLPQHETDCLNRPTIRFVDALYWLASRLHPDMSSAIDKWKTDTEKTLKEFSARDKNHSN